MPDYVVAGSKPWNHRAFDEIITTFPGRWHFIGVPEEMTRERMDAWAPRYIFFLHWSWKVPSELISRYECVCFHMTDVPYGRGGSPLQNLIARGHRHTKLTALRMTEEVDAGPVYMKEDLCLEGNAEEIYIRASYLSARMIKRIVDENPTPQPQEGQPTCFGRRSPCQSVISEVADLQALHDFIRMLDGEGYPRAYLEYAGFRFEFSRAALYDGRIVADVTITPLQMEKS